MFSYHMEKPLFNSVFFGDMSYHQIVEDPQWA